MKQRFQIFCWLCLLIILLSFSALAEETGARVQFGDDVYVSKGQTINGDSVTISGDQMILGNVTGSAIAIFGDIEIVGGSVAGEAVSIFGKVTMRENAKVMGDVVSVMGEVHRTGDTFVAGDEVSVGPNMALGEIVDNLPFHFTLPNLWVWRVSGWFSGTLMSILLTLLVIYFMLPNLKEIKKVIEEEPVKVGLRGLIGILAVIGVSILFAITIIGIPVALLLGLVWWITNFIGLVTIYYMVGERIAPHLNIENPTPYVQGVLGSITFSLIAILPYAVGGLIKIIISLLGFGGVLMTRFGTNKPWIK